MTISRRAHALVASVSFAAVFAVVAVPGSAQAAPIGSDGVVHACYKAKGKDKGAVRVVKAGKPCKRKEKATTWSVAGPVGAGGGSGTGAPGLTTSQLLSLLQLLQAQAGQIDALTGRIVSLEGILAGVTNADLDAILDSLPILDTVCDQVSTLTGQSNALRQVISGLGLNGILTGLGGLLNIPALPSVLSPFDC